MADDYYSRISEGYDELYGAEQDAKLKAFLEKHMLPPGCTVLDVGCGTGRSRWFMQHVRWQGVEPSEGLIAQAREETRKKIILGSAESLPFPDNMFDVVLSVTAMQNFDDPAKALDEMNRVVRGNALIMISFLKKSQKAEALDAMVRSQLVVQEHWEQEKDFMYICTSRS